MLYEYFGPDRIDVLQNRRIRSAPPVSLTIPFEFRPVLKTVGSVPELQQQLDAEFNNLIKAELAKIGPTLSIISKAQLDHFIADARTKTLTLLRSLEPVLVSLLRRKFDDTFNKHFGVLCLSEVSS